MPRDNALLLHAAFTDIRLFSAAVLRRPLRNYQLAPAVAIARSVATGAGLTFAVMMSRQSGKNETSAQLEAMLLNQHRRAGGSIVKAAPTFRPQAVTSLHRLIDVHAQSPLPPPHKEQAYIVRVGRATCSFYGAGKDTNVVGATASLLLEGDEAQDLNPDKWNKDFRPMAASTAATTVLYGTAWTTDTLLATTITALERLERQDGIHRVYKVPWDMVALELPAYGRYVAAEIARLGSHHPLVRTQYMLQEIDELAGMFSPQAQALMHGQHTRAIAPTGNTPIAFALDVAGEQTTAGINARKDSTALTIAAIGRTPTGLPTYRVLHRMSWTGIASTALVQPLSELVDLWRPAHMIIDATGLGTGLAALLRPVLRDRLIEFIFTGKSKSDLGWNFLGMCNSGRFTDHILDNGADQATFWQQVRMARYELAAENQTMHWSVPDPTIHDDYLISAALLAALPDPPAPPQSAVVNNPDPLE